MMKLPTKVVKVFLISLLLAICLGTVSTIWFVQTFLPDVYANLTRAFPREGEVPILKEQFYSRIEQVIHRMPDTLVEQRSISDFEASRGRSYAGCIRGTSELVFGSNRTFEEVSKSFGNLLSENSDWIKILDSIAFAEKNFEVWLYTINSGIPNSCDTFSLCYAVRVKYGDPGVDACYGG